MAKGNYPVTITAVDNGFLVTAGCITLVFEKVSQLLVELAEWFADPAKVEEKYFSQYRGAAYEGGVPQLSGEAHIRDAQIRGLGHATRGL